MIQAKAQQDSGPYIKIRTCSRCGREISFLDHIIVMAKSQNNRYNSYELNKLIEFWEEFHNENVDVYCHRCHFYFSYGVCQCEKYRSIKTIIIRSKHNKREYFPSCRICALEIFGKDFDNYDEHQKEIILRRRKHD